MLGFTYFWGGAFRVDYALASYHQVNIAGFDNLDATDRVAVHELTFKHISDCGEVDVGVGPYVDALAYGELGGAGVVEEYPRTYLALLS